MNDTLLRAAHGLLIAAARQYAIVERHLETAPVDVDDAQLEELKRAEREADEMLQLAASAFGSTKALHEASMVPARVDDLEDSFDEMTGAQ